MQEQQWPTGRRKLPPRGVPAARALATASHAQMGEAAEPLRRLLLSLAQFALPLAALLSQGQRPERQSPPPKSTLTTAPSSESPHPQHHHGFLVHPDLGAPSFFEGKGRTGQVHRRHGRHGRRAWSRLGQLVVVHFISLFLSFNLSRQP